MSALNTFSLYEFGWYKVGRAKEVDKNKAELYVEFYARDFLGLGSLAERLTGKQQKRGSKEYIPFHLQRRRYKWYIVDIGSQVGSLIDAVYKVRKYK